MNTKILLLTIILLIVFPNAISVDASNQKEILNLEIPASPSDNKQQDRSMDWTLAWSYEDDSTHSQPTEDGKSHHFHFDRICKNRRKIAVIALMKIFLLIIHTSSFLYSLIHLLH
ncbi:MAG: hypothetical protein ABIO04_03280 [Ferruginibacter sp.]